MIESSMSPDQSGSTRLISMLRASGPSIPSTSKASPSQANIATQRSSAAAMMDRNAQKAPLAVSRCTENARHFSYVVTTLPDRASLLSVPPSGQPLA